MNDHPDEYPDHPQAASHPLNLYSKHAELFLFRWVYLPNNADMAAKHHCHREWLQVRTYRAHLVNNVAVVESFSRG